MVVCKFFQQGHCRYGQSCRFEHVYGSKYSYHVNQVPQQQQQPSTVTDEQLVNQVQNDIQAALKGNQWILSCYSPFKEKPLFPGFHDLSPEETRLYIYEAKANNNLGIAIAYINNLIKEAHQKYERLLHPDPTIVNILRSLYKGENVSSPFENTPSAFQNMENGFVNNNDASSIFRSALQTQTPTNSIFNQSQQNCNPKDIFSMAAKQSAFAQNTNIFNKPQESSAKSIFAQANQNVFQQNAQMPQNIFATANQNTAPTNIFATANNRSAFEQEDKQTSPFTQTQQNVFQKSEAMQSTNVFHNNVIHDGVYSRTEDLNPEELEAFKSDSFQLGFIPEIAPPQELCIDSKGFNYF